MSVSVLGIADDRALGSSVRVIVTRPQSLTAAKAAVDDVLRAIDAAASRFREDSELSRLNAAPDHVVKVSPLLAKAIGKEGGVLVSLGGDIAVAGEPPPQGWSIQASEDAAMPISDSDEAVSINSGGMATSGTTVRRWVRGQTIMHHIIDPATGLPADSIWRTATVVAGSCVDANIASTAAIVLSDRAPAWLVERKVAAP